MTRRETGTGTYDDAFYRHIRDGSRRSARAVCSRIAARLPPRSVLDVGCGDGSWLEAWTALGVGDVLGVDGGHLAGRKLLVPRERFLPLDLVEPFDLGRRFDLVQSLEVAEHLPPSSAAGFVDSLVRHSDVVLFSAAPPGQFGNHHVNERPYEYWRRLFAARGYDCYDFVRPSVAGAPDVEPWYRYNAFLYVARGAAPTVAPRLGDCRVPDEVALRDTAPAAWRLRKLLFRLVPSRVGTALARLSARWTERAVRHRGAPDA